jgi:hypothetical protein
MIQSESIHKYLIPKRWVTNMASWKVLLNSAQGIFSRFASMSSFKVRNGCEGNKPQQWLKAL